MALNVLISNLSGLKGSTITACLVRVRLATGKYLKVGNFRFFSLHEKMKHCRFKIVLLPSNSVEEALLIIRNVIKVPDRLARFCHIGVPKLRNDSFTH